MQPALQKGQLITWKDDRGFGFIKPDNGGKEVFLHISVLQRAGRRPKVGDTVLYDQVVESDGKIRAVRASIQGVAPQPLGTKRALGTKRKNRKGGLLKTVGGVVTLVAIVLAAIYFGPGRSPSPITSIAKPGCEIKGNISVESGKKLYHLPGMEDYESTRIDPGRGEQWFCSEAEAIARGWRKAPK